MRCPRLVHLLALVGLLLGGLLVAAPHPAAAQDEVCFAETGFCVRGRFLAYWQEHGGLAINGYPLSDERQELLEDGNTYTVQYFERVRMEYHPENPAPWDVELGQFGRRALLMRDIGGPPDTSPVAPQPGMTFFPETGHNLGGGFLDYWQGHGGLAQFGFPLTEVIEERLVPNTPTTYQVQYFERARFELHPENAPPYDIELGQFGRQILSQNARLASVPEFQRLFITREHLQEALGYPIEAATSAPGAYQPFEHGAMIARSDIQSIYVLCGSPQSGQVFQGPRLEPFLPDTWTPSQPVGGGPGPQAGLYEPARGFGKLWREYPGVRDCLGYATAPDETPSTVVVQRFYRGALVSTTTPAGPFIYALYITTAPGSSPLRYERYPNPAP
jgi:hypothetical protein